MRAADLEVDLPYALRERDQATADARCVVYVRTLDKRHNNEGKAVIVRDGDGSEFETRASRLICRWSALESVIDAERRDAELSAYAETMDDTDAAAAEAIVYEVQGNSPLGGGDDRLCLEDEFLRRVGVDGTGEELHPLAYRVEGVRRPYLVVPSQVGLEIVKRFAADNQDFVVNLVEQESSSDPKWGTRDEWIATWTPMWNRMLEWAGLPLLDQPRPLLTTVADLHARVIEALIEDLSPGQLEAAAERIRALDDGDVWSYRRFLDAKADELSRSADDKRSGRNSG